MKDYHVAAYYFPNYHVDSLNEKWHGRGWTEWQLMRSATPRFEGHDQPKIPLWGYADESDPAVMGRKIEAAVGHGLEAFIFDWYWYNDEPYLHRALEEGFLKADNTQDLKFSLMWANHDWMELQPAIRGEVPMRASGAVDVKGFERATQYMIEHYFNQPNYWRVDDKLYFSIYELNKIVENLGGAESARVVFADLRRRVQEAGLGELHLNGVVWGVQLLPGTNMLSKPEEILEYLGFDSATSYVWIHHMELEQFPATAYETLLDKAREKHYEFDKQYRIPYFPNVSMGWDPSPRTIQTDMYENLGYPYSATITGNSPRLFKKALLDAREFLDSSPKAMNILTINAWNEWTEGSYLEPDTKNGYGCLEAIRDVFR